jgi:hypothetical protein|uniref:Uncharacterized protein n=1 Tax=virus sp. ctRTq15 TaxID=2828253 RepID=A0A8S5RAG2_9VIRU|nr:MAG TPA: hypothetical protein [virus sp. ctRTq15]
MREPYVIKGDEQQRSLQDYIEQIALGVADDVIKGEKNETIQSECRILNSLTNALLAIKC